MHMYDCGRTLCSSPTDYVHDQITDFVRNLWWYLVKLTLLNLRKLGYE